MGNWQTELLGFRRPWHANAWGQLERCRRVANDTVRRGGGTCNHYFANQSATSGYWKVIKNNEAVKEERRRQWGRRTRNGLGSNRMTGSAHNELAWRKRALESQSRQSQRQNLLAELPLEPAPDWNGCPRRYRIDANGDGYYGPVGNLCIRMWLVSQWGRKGE